MKFVNIVLLTVMAAAPAWADTDTTVLILGAGATGMAAAASLKQQGIDYLIIEALDRVGGRMESREFSGKTVQPGASWVQGTEGSILFDLVTKSGTVGFYTDFDNADLALADEYELYDESYELLNDAWEREEETLECMDTQNEVMQKSGESDISIRQIQKYCGWGTYQDKFSECVEVYTYDFEFADLPVTTSFKNSLPLTVYEIYEDEDYEITDAKGWGKVFEYMGIPSEKIMFTSMVSKVDYSDSGVTVVAMQTGDDGTATEVSLKADYVLCTFSIGVLQSDHEALFNPTLPDTYKRELFKFDMNTYTKVYFEFPVNFWGTELEYFLHADDQRGYFPTWQNMGVIYEDENYNVLMVTITGPQGMRIEQQTNDKTKAEAMEVLKFMFGVDIPDPTDMYVPRWNDNPLFRGSYSNWPIGTSSVDHIELGTFISDRLMIRGEATSPGLNGWMHGAFTEGQQAAKDIKACIDFPNGQLCKCANDPTCNTHAVKSSKAKNSKAKKSSKAKKQKAKKSKK